jgi:branched-chain amino acid transport system substrate-binding protein
MKRLVNTIIIVVLLAGTFMASCAKKTEEVKVGILLPLTGPQAITGLKIKNGYQFAADQINAGGGIKSLGGVKIKLIYGDTEGQPNVGISEIQRLIERERVCVIMGCFQSSVAMATTQVAEHLRTPYIVGNPMADEITDQGFGYIFRITAKSSWMARDQMQFLEDVGARSGKKVATIALLYEDTDFGQSTARGQRKYAKEFGYQIVADLPYPHQTSDITPTILRIRQANPDVILATSYDTDAVLIMRAMAELKYKPTFGYIGSTGGYINPHFISAASALSEHVFTSNLWNHDLKKPAARQFYDQYKARFQEDPVPQDAIAYAAMYVFKDALERCKSIDRDKIRDALVETNIAGGPTDILPYDRIRFDKTGQNIEVSLIMVQIIGGEYVTVWPFEVARKDAIWPVK